MCLNAALSENFFIAEKNNLEDQLVDNNTSLQLAHKQESAKIENIRFMGDNEEELVRIEMEGLDTRSEEYEQLLSEINDIRDEEDREIEQIERQSTDFETEIQQENVVIETRLEAINTDLDALGDLKEEHIKEQFGYFQ